MRWQDAKRIALWGYGREGQAAQRFLQKVCAGATFTVLLDGAGDVAGLPVLRGSAVGEALAQGAFDLLVTSPGVSLYRPEIVAAKKAGVLVTTGSALWFETHVEVPTVGITGTKGKSTITRLVHHLLTQSGVDVALAGNVGVPLLDTLPGKAGAIVELSSYQCASLTVAPSVFVLANLYPEHVPWHGSVEQYYSDKARIATLEPVPTVVANAAEPEVVARLDGYVDYWYNAPHGWRAEGERLWRGPEAVAVADFPLKGAHNWSNLAAACVAIEAFGYDPKPMLKHVGTFEQLPHRLQEVGRVGGMLCVNDSISTVPQAALAALQAYAGKPIVLIAGGYDRGQDYGLLASRLGELGVVKVLALPVTGERLAEAAMAAGVPAEPCATLDEAVAKGLAMGVGDGVLLLSPAAPSFGMFKDFEERGERFVTLCKEAGVR